MTSRFESILNRIQNSYEIGDTSVEIERDFILGHSYHFESPIFIATISSHCDGITCGYYRIEINYFNRRHNNHEVTSCWFTSDYARMVESLLAEIR